MWYELQPHKAPDEFVSVAFRANSGNSAGMGRGGRRMVLSVSGALVDRMGWARGGKVNLLIAPELRKMLLMPAVAMRTPLALIGRKKAQNIILPIDAPHTLGAQAVERVAFTVEGSRVVLDFPRWFTKLPALAAPPPGAKPVAVPGLSLPPAEPAPVPATVATPAPASPRRKVRRMPVPKQAKAPEPVQPAPAVAAPAAPRAVHMHIEEVPEYLAGQPSIGEADRERLLRPCHAVYAECMVHVDGVPVRHVVQHRWPGLLEMADAPVAGGGVVTVGETPSLLTDRERAELVGMPAPRDAAPDEPAAIEPAPAVLDQLQAETLLGKVVVAGAMPEGMIALAQGSKLTGFSIRGGGAASVDITAPRIEVSADGSIRTFAVQGSELVQLRADQDPAPAAPDQLQAEAPPVELVAQPDGMPDPMPGLVAAVKADPVLDAFCRRVARQTAEALSPSAEPAPITAPLMPHLRQVEVKESPVLVDLARKPYLLQGASLGAMARFEGLGAEFTGARPMLGGRIVAPPAAEPDQLQAEPATAGEPAELVVLQDNGDGTFQELARVQPSAAHATAAEADDAIEALRQDMQAKVPAGVTVRREGAALVMGEVQAPAVAEELTEEARLIELGVEPALAGVLAGDDPVPVDAEEPGQVAAPADPAEAERLAEVQSHVLDALPLVTGSVTARQLAAEDRARKARIAKAAWEEAEERLCKNELVVTIADELELPSAELSKLARELRKAGRRK